MAYYEIGDDGEVYVAGDEEDVYVGESADDILDIGVRVPARGRAPRRQGGMMPYRANANRMQPQRMPRMLPPVAREINSPQALLQAPLPVDSGATIAAATQATIFTRPQMIFKPRSLLIGNAIAPSFTIDDIKVGNSSQLVAAGQLPGEVFSNLTAQLIQLKGETVQGGLDLVTQVTNQSGGALRFRGTYLGQALKFF